MVFKTVHFIFALLWVSAASVCGESQAQTASAASTISSGPSAPVPGFSRIIALAPVLSEWAAELLGKSATEKTLIAVSEYSIYPSYLGAKPTIGAYFKLDVEKIAALKPDLIIASSEYNRPEQIEQLKRLHLQIAILPGEKFTTMPTWIQNLGKILHEERSGSEVANRWSAEVKALASKKKSNPESLFLEVQHQPLVTIGSESFLNDAFSLVGYENIFMALPQAYPKVSKEAVLAKKPQNVFVLDLTGKPEDFKPAIDDWQKFGFHARVLSGNDFARCSFALLKGLRGL